MIENLQGWAQSFPGWLQWLAIFLIAAIPLIEAYTGTFIGIAIGLHPIAALTAAVAGNATTVLIIVFAAGRIRDRVRRRHPERDDAKPAPSRLHRLFDRFGIPGVALLGHPTQISSAAMVGFGADRRKVIIWELVSIVGWAIVIAIAAEFGINALIHR